ncbi:hypothetical protein F4779DRAFT_586007 [Xylariaceae sp. FL0662B]|nr:hypothetical protein F4779DRAFT_586007 [Xylariaceae sp. FL0662B]
MTTPPESGADPHFVSPPSTASTAGTNPDRAVPTPKRRAPIACRRCRRMRSKCIHERAPPCKSCREANVPEECIFPMRGDSDQDRLFRHPRQRADNKSRSDTAKVKKESAASAASPGSLHDVLVDHKPPKLGNEWDLLPGIDIVISGIDTFTKHYYQLGFIPKKRFPKELQENPAPVSVFLLLSILSISARFNRRLIDIYGDGIKAATEFMHKAQRLAVQELYQQPTLERCQAFYLLSIAEQGSGQSNTSYISAGIAFRMAALMRLHREETYSPITIQSPVQHRIRAEAARRTFWMLHSQDNLHSGPYKPSSLPPSDITALLPSDEADFEAGRIPERRAALDGTPPAIQDPNIASLRPRSLFASLMQVHNLWGTVTRRVLFDEKCWQPNDGDSEYAKLNQRLLEWEEQLPSEHVFGKILLGGYRHYSEELAYLGLTQCLRLCHIVLRREYMDQMIRLAEGDLSNPEVRFYKNMATELFCNVRRLYEQIDVHFEDGVVIERVGSQMAVFTVYGCGLLASYLCKFPQLGVYHSGHNLEAIQAEGRKMYCRMVGILRECQSVWPLAETWCNGLEKWYEDTNPKRISFKAGTMTDGKEPQPYALHVMHPRITTTAFKTTTSSFHHHPHAIPSPGVEHSVIEEDFPEPPRLAPLQQTQPNYIEPICLPSLSQAEHIAHHQQPTTPQPPPRRYSPQQSYPNSGLEMLLQASHQTPPPTHYNTTPYYSADYPTMPLNDGFDSNLQILVNGSPQWNTADSAAVICNPCFLPQKV